VGAVTREMIERYIASKTPAAKTRK
jgi:hypothetical protein